ncbi:MULTISPECIES: septum formation family protein [unclassified Pseudofrankia]|uniref:septum formation family protein n=1 Tax=unclassified Pseudofrankia TaxID=2994372 RepID=UPI001F519E53|nr:MULTISPECIES: septum formation family protein [unclassified Pseudofrankia]MDT3443737.1 septum formation family protein [Pseudofrankia sp. BMG5.37]
MASPEREPAEHRDPFENLHLDEGFVRAARFIEPSAAERGRTADRRDPGRCQVVPASRRLPAGMHRMVWAPRPGFRRRRAARVVAFLAVLAGVISIVVALRHSNSRAGTTAAAAPGTARTSPTASAPLAPRTAGGVLVTPPLLSSLRVGDCVNWDPASSAGADAAEVVQCGQPHRAEVIKLIDLSLSLPGVWPGRSELDGLLPTNCGDAFNSYVSHAQPGRSPVPGHAQPGASPVSGALEPGPDAWDQGVKTLACTAQLPGLTSLIDQLGAVATPA